MQPTIIDRGRGPEISGTRITVYDVLDYLELQWEPVRIASFFRVSIEQVQAAIQYIDQHRAEVEDSHREMVARAARGNSPELQAQIDATRPRFLQTLHTRELHQNGQGGASEGNSCGR